RRRGQPKASSRPTKEETETSAQEHPFQFIPEKLEGWPNPAVPKPQVPCQEERIRWPRLPVRDEREQGKLRCDTRLLQTGHSAVASSTARRQADSNSARSTHSRGVWISFCPAPSVTVGMPCRTSQLASRPPLVTRRCGSRPTARTAARARWTTGSSSRRRNGK